MYSCPITTRKCGFWFAQCYRMYKIMNYWLLAIVDFSRSVWIFPRLSYYPKFLNNTNNLKIRKNVYILQIRGWSKGFGEPISDTSAETRSGSGPVSNKASFYTTYRQKQGLYVIRIVYTNCKLYKGWIKPKLCLAWLKPQFSWLESGLSKKLGVA